MSAYPKCRTCGNGVYQSLIHTEGEPFVVGSTAQLIWKCDPCDAMWNLRGEPLEFVPAGELEATS